MVMVKASLAATKPKVLAGAYLLESNLPTALLECGLGEALLEYQAMTWIWRLVLEHYPGPGMILRFMVGREEES